jgi:hypothetical protein
MRYITPKMVMDTRPCEYWTKKRVLKVFNGKEKIHVLDVPKLKGVGEHNKYHVLSRIFSRNESKYKWDIYEDINRRDSLHVRRNYENIAKALYAIGKHGKRNA